MASPTSAGTTTGTTSVFGNVQPPAGVAKYDDAAGGLGLILFVSNLIKLVTVGAGLLVVVNVVYAGFLYLSAPSDTATHTKVKDQLTFSVIGLAIIVASYAIAILLGVVFFGNPTYIINPVVCGPGEC